MCGGEQIMSKQRIWFITGISRGLAKALAWAVLAVGDAVNRHHALGKSRLGFKASRD